MKLITGILLMLALILTGCGKTEDEISTVYQITSEAVTDAGCHRAAEMRPDGTYVWSKSDYDREGNNRSGTYLTKDGTDIKLSSQTAERIFQGERGIYTIEPSPENLSSKILKKYGYDGSLIVSVPAAEIRPDGADGNYPGDNDDLPRILPMAETDDGIFLLWGSYLLTLSDEFAVTGTEKLPGLGFAVFDDGDPWVLFREKKSMKLTNTATDAVYEVPARFAGTGTFTQAELCAVHEGYAYAWDSYGLFRWDADDPAAADAIAVTEMADFMESGIPGSALQQCVPDFSGDGMTLGVRWGEAASSEQGMGFVYRLARLAPASAENGDFVMLELACVGQNNDTAAKIIAFNRTHADVKISVTDYSRFDTADDRMAGVNRLRMDLETGILKPDLLLLSDLLYAEMAADMTGYFTDLYPLMTGDVKPEDLWRCARSFESDGKLYAVGTRFGLASLTGKTEKLNGVTSLTFGDVLNLAENIPDGISLTGSLTKSSAQNLFLRYQAKTFSDGAFFTGQEFKDFITWMNTLPKTLQSSQQTGTGALDLITGNAPGNSSVSEESENPYCTGKALLADYSVNDPTAYLSALNTFGVNDPDELSWIGYPTGEENGILVAFDSVLAIPSCSDAPGSAWEFIEWMLVTAGDEISAVTEDPGMKFTALKQPYLDYMNALTGTEVFFSAAGYRIIGRDLHEKYTNGAIDGVPGILYAFDSSHAEALAGLLDTPCMTAAAMTDSDLLGIILEELNRPGDPETIAESVRSRAALYLAEKQ
ncbi:MAG: hypothetical protein IJF78_13185 [Clostridia bacterium]|nr:hypothetical protein [Clostridia bacterium]